MSSSPLALDPVIVPLVRGSTVLDVGCGYGRWGALLRTNAWEAPGRDDHEGGFVVDGLDAFEPNVSHCGESGNYRRVWQHILPAPFEGVWDTVLACECIEHVQQSEVADTIAVLEHAARRRLIFSTPNFPAYRDGDETMLGFNPFEAHLSYVSRREWKSRGYRLIGVGWGNYRDPFVRASKHFKMGLEPMLESFPRTLPYFGEQLVTYRDFDGSG